jgi:hypothetical protein
VAVEAVVRVWRITLWVVGVDLFVFVLVLAVAR